jgi:hypothetical protein
MGPATAPLMATVMTVKAMARNFMLPRCERLVVVYARPRLRTVSQGIFLVVGVRFWISGVPKR